MDIMELRTNQALLQALFAAKTKKPTAEELRKQRVSFIYGSLGGKSNVTRDQIEHILDMQEGKVMA